MVVGFVLKILVGKLFLIMGKIGEGKEQRRVRGAKREECKGKGGKQKIVRGEAGRRLRRVTVPTVLRLPCVRMQE